MTSPSFSEVIVRHIDKSDRKAVGEWLKDPVVRSAIEDETIRPGRAAGTLGLLESSDPLGKGDLCLIVEKASRPIGLIYFAWINWVSRNAEVVVFIGPEEDRRSITALKAVEKVADTAFNELNLHKIYAFVYASNRGSLALFRKLMKTEACFRGYLKTEAGREDMVMLGMLEPEYRRIMGRLAPRLRAPAEA